MDRPIAMPFLFLSERTGPEFSLHPFVHRISDKDNIRRLDCICMCNNKEYFYMRYKYRINDLVWYERYVTLLVSVHNNGCFGVSRLYRDWVGIECVSIDHVFPICSGFTVCEPDCDDSTTMTTLNTEYLIKVASVRPN